MSASTATPTPLGGVLTPRMERLIRVGSVGSAVIIAVSAMILSYSGLHDLALDAEIHPRLALLVPIMVDGLQFVGSLGVVYSTLSGLRSWYPWLLMLMGVSISAWGNWQAAPDSLTAKLLHAAAPVILALVLEELLRVMRHKVQIHAAAHEALVAESASEASADETPPPVVGPAPVPSPVIEPVESPTDPDREADGQGENPQPLVEGESFPVSDVTAAEPVEAAVVAPVDGARTEVASTVPEPLSGSPRWQDQTSQWATQADADGQRLAAAMEAAGSTTATPVVQPAPEPVTPQAVEPAAEATMDREAIDGDERLPFYPADAPLKEQVRSILLADPEIPAAKIARIIGKDASYTRKTVRIVKAELDEAAAQPAAVTPPAPQAPTQRVAPSPEPVREQSPSRPVAGDDLTGADPFAVGTPVLVGRG